MNRIKEILNQPFMAYTSGRHNAPLVIWSGVFVFIFLAVFKPFEIHEISPSKVLYVGFLIGYGFITSLSVLIMIEGVGRLLPTIFSEKNWKIKHEISFVVGLISLITILNYFFTLFISDLTFSLESFFFMVFATVTVSFFPAVSFVMFRYVRNVRLYSQPKTVTVFNSEQNEKYENDMVELFAENNRDSIVLSPENLLFIESDDNYSTVFFTQHNRIKKKLLRNTLTRLEAQVESYPTLKRCHRSYLVNIKKVNRVSGNAQGYRLHLQNTDEIVPVSRTYSKNIIAEL
jgi:hypothetical protein